MITKLWRRLRNIDRIEELEQTIDNQHDRYFEVTAKVDELSLDAAKQASIAKAVVNTLATELAIARIDLDYAKQILYLVATSPEVSSLDDAIDVSYEAYSELTEHER